MRISIYKQGEKMKKLLLLISSALLLVGCESKIEKLAGCYWDINHLTSQSFDFIIKIAEAWEEAEDGYDMGYQDSHFDSDFKKINDKTDWSSIFQSLNDAEKVLKKKMPQKYQPAQKELYKLFNIGREIRSLAKSVKADSDVKDDYDEFVEKAIDLREKYEKQRVIINEKHPEIKGALYSFDELFE